MRLATPFDNFSHSVRKRALIAALVLTAILLITLRSLDQPLKTHVAPLGIVSYELAKNYDQSRQILKSWDATARIRAALSLGLDYLFLIVYALFISLACIQVARGLQGHIPFFARLAPALVWAQFFAAFLDAVENWALIQLLLNSSRHWLPLLARWCAVIKFGIVGVGLLFIFSGILIIGLKKTFT